MNGRRVIRIGQARLLRVRWQAGRWRVRLLRQRPAPQAGVTLLGGYPLRVFTRTSGPVRRTVPAGRDRTMLAFFPRAGWNRGTTGFERRIWMHL